MDYNGINFETPAEYYSKRWDNLWDDRTIITRRPEEYYETEWDKTCIPEWSVSPSRSERLTVTTKMEENSMLPDIDNPIYELICSGFNIFTAEAKFEIKEVIFNNPATIVYWQDGTKTVVTDMDNVVDGKTKPCESYSKETGLALCFMKKALGNKGNYNNAFREWIKED